MSNGEPLCSHHWLHLIPNPHALTFLELHGTSDPKFLTDGSTRNSHDRLDANQVSMNTALLRSLLPVLLGLNMDPGSSGKLKCEGQTSPCCCGCGSLLLNAIATWHCQSQTGNQFRLVTLAYLGLLASKGYLQGRHAFMFSQREIMKWLIMVISCSDINAWLRLYLAWTSNGTAQQCWQIQVPSKLAEGESEEYGYWSNKGTINN